MSVQTLLMDAIETDFEELNKMEVGTDKYEKTINGLTKLVDRAIEMEKFDSEFEDKKNQLKADEKLKQVQMEEEKKDRLIRNCISVAGIVIPSILTVWGTLKSLKFEEEGTVTTLVGRGFINKLLPKK